MRAHRQTTGVHPEGMSLTPMVNRYKLHLAAVKSLVPEKLHRTANLNEETDPRFCDPTGERNTHPSLTKNYSKTDQRSAGGRRRPEAPSVLLLAGRCLDSVHGGASDLQPNPGDRPRRPAQSAGYRKDGSTFPPPRQSGDWEEMDEGSLHRLPSTLLSREVVGSSSERIDLDRRCLDACPQLGCMDGLRLLNLQHNRIPRVLHLSQLQRLVFLDLYHNQLCDMAGLEGLLSLRVLMLGQNRIRKLSCLENLSKLEVLDLHANQITRITNVSHLGRLRLLNLAGNDISRVENLQGLDSLTELNLQRNCISSVTELETLPCLQRLFLSWNNISSLAGIPCLGDSCPLSELTLDGNPVALETWYRQAVLRCVLHLKQLDMKRITDEERRMAAVQARREDEKKKETHKQAVHKEKRRLAIRNAAQQWEGVRASLEPPPPNGAKEEVSPENSPAHSPAQTNGIAQEPSPDEPKRVSPLSGPEKPTIASENRLRVPSRPNSPRDPKLLEAGSAVQILSLSEQHLAELDGDTLRLVGPGALEALERGWGAQTAGAVCTITFRYVQFDAIVPTLPRIRVKFPNLTHLVFMETNLSRLVQLAALAQLRRVEQLTIHPEGNPVAALALWRPFLIYRLHHFNLQRLNGLEVTMNDVIAAERVFGTLGLVAATETPRCRLLLLLEESRKRQLQFHLEGRGRRPGQSPEELRENGKLLGEGLSRALFNYPCRDGASDSSEEGAVEPSERAANTQQYLQELVQRASDTHLKGEALHKLWPSLFVEMVRDCVLDMRDRPSYRQACLLRLSHSK
ncbi:leucine-rich repeat-containing protein 49 [Gadus chalcogrammus]|uniref:leucine-rich repeat-containing protein 49 n=1 Tax=Gadus chalcogrammus TaxID=1042646 RepID=UPI0024C4862A|nr:leucine-rich repeat-containing protein 49 [Gadus chalcogrammus]